MASSPIAALEIGTTRTVLASPLHQGAAEESFRWISQAASEGLPEAQYRLALLYSIGRGCTASAAKAISWARAAAAQRHPQALLFLSSCLRHGDGIACDLAAALALAYRAIAESDGQLGRGALAELEALASAAERSEAARIEAENDSDASLIATVFLHARALAKARGS